VQGKVKELRVDEGSAVSAGEAVALLEQDELVKVKAEIEASLKAAEFNYQQAREDYDRLQSLFETGAISAQRRDTAKTIRDSAQSQVDALRASFDLAVTRLGFTELVSPIDGFILTKSAEVGEVILPGVTVFTVADLKNVWLTAYIGETDLGRVRLNQVVTVRIDTYPGKIYQGRISFISQEAEFTPKQIQTLAERVKLVYRIKVIIDNAQFELKPGMPADGYIKIAP